MRNPKKKSQAATKPDSKQLLQAAREIINQNAIKEEREDEFLQIRLLHSARRLFQRKESRLSNENRISLIKVMKNSMLLQDMDDTIQDDLGISSHQIIDLLEILEFLEELD